MTRPTELQRRSILVVAALTMAASALTLGVHGQTGIPKPAATPSASAPVAVPASSVPNAPQPQGSAAVQTIRAHSNLVVLDVVVSDAKKNPVHGLQKSDFTLTENGKPQVIRNFEEHTALPLSETSKILAPPPLPAGLFTNKSAAPANGPVNVILLDYLNTPLTAQPNERKQLMNYLDKAPAGTRIAIFGLTTHLILLHGFTSDMSVLKAALESKKGAPQASDIMSDAFNGGSQGDTTLSNALALPTAVEGMTTQEMVDEVHRFEALTTTFEQGMIATYTLNAFDELARYLVGIPGRKNVIWFSGGFPLDIEPNVDEADPMDSSLRNDEEIRKTDNLLTRAQVAVYPVDVLGVQTDPALSFAGESSQSMVGATIDDSTAKSVTDARMDSMTQQAKRLASMQTFAEDTGGSVFVNTNNLTMAVSKAIEQGSNYYTLTYSPTDTEWDSRFRTIKIKVADSIAKNLSYRNGYFAVDPDDRNKLVAGGAAVAMGRPSTMSTAMMHGGPDLTQILFKARIRPAGTPPDETVVKSNQVNPNLDVKGPFQQYREELVPDARSVSCLQQADGNYHCAIEVWTFVYNNKGEKLITASNRLFNRLTPAEYNKLLTGGMAFHQQISVPVKGEYYIRTAIHDLNSDNVGAMELAVAQIRRLAPLKQIAETPSDAPAAPDAAGTDSAPNAGGTPAAPAKAAPAVPVVTP